MAKIVPLTLISGFLGAGKTTLLAQLLTQNKGIRIAVLVNDFGPLNIDAEQIVAIEGETVSLTNGCICCTIRNDLMEEVLALLAKDTPPEHIVIEASGVSDPSLIAHTFQIPALNGVVEIESIITVVDAEQTLDLEPEFTKLARKQIQLADLIILNKVDLVSKTHLNRVEKHIHKIAVDARILKAVNCAVPLDLLVGQRLFDGSKLDSDEGTHHLQFQTWTYECHQPFTFIALRKALEQIPAQIYRAKGFISLENAPAEQGLFQFTGGRSWLRLGQEWHNIPRHTRIVFIGTKDSLNPVEVNTAFDENQAKYSRKALENNTTPPVIENLSALQVLFG